jgi:hypothetical protein
MYSANPVPKSGKNLGGLPTCWAKWMDISKKEIKFPNICILRRALSFSGYLRFAK